MAQLEVTELDFETIKQNLKTFLSSQEEFADYNFEASGLSVLVDILAYNTHYNGTLAHFLANEMFLDSAVKRNSVVSIAKTLGYTPTSRRAAVANVTFEIDPPDSYTNTGLTISREAPFTAKIGNKTYTFYPREDYYSGLVTLETGQTGFSYTMDLIEGKRVSNRFVVDLSNKSGPFVLPNQNIDTTTIRVRVQESSTNITTSSWNFYDEILDVTSTTRGFFVEEGPSGLYEVRFGDDIIGASLAVGNIVSIDYIVTNGLSANNISSFTASSNFTGSGEIKNIYPINSSTGGQEKQSIDSVRYNAPKFNATKNRAVTSNDYEALIKSRFSNINSLTVWGGEENIPPIYGKVFISIQPQPGSIVSQADKDIISRDIIRPRSVVSIQPEYVDPITTYIGLSITANYDKNITTLTSSRIESEIRTIVNNFFSSNLNKLQKNFYYSKLSSAVTNTTKSIYSNNIQLRVHRRLPVIIGVAEQYEVYFNFELENEAFRTTNFTTTITGEPYEVYITDGHVNTREELGSLVMRRVSDDAIIMTDVGSIDYINGVVTIPQLTIDILSGTENELRFYVEPHGYSPDILTSGFISTTALSTGPVFPFAARNTVLALDDTSAANAAANIPQGLTITAIANVQD
jgi:hypothetical protein